MCRTREGTSGVAMDVSRGREVLPTNVKPLHYDLTLEPNFENFSYEGTVKIEYVDTLCGELVRRAPNLGFVMRAPTDVKIPTAST